MLLGLVKVMLPAWIALAKEARLMSVLAPVALIVTPPVPVLITPLWLKVDPTVKVNVPDAEVPMLMPPILSALASRMEILPAPEVVRLTAPTKSLPRLLKLMDPPVLVKEEVPDIFMAPL